MKTEFDGKKYKASKKTLGFVFVTKVKRHTSHGLR